MSESSVDHVAHCYKHDGYYDDDGHCPVCMEQKRITELENGNEALKLCHAEKEARIAELEAGLKMAKEAVEDMMNGGEILQDPLMQELLVELVKLENP